jgi:hypothetical protein
MVTGRDLIENGWPEGPTPSPSTRPESSARPALFARLLRETVRKGVRATLRALIWSAYRGQNGPNGVASAT